MGVIYSIINPVGQIYVGSTKDLDNRIMLHLKDSKKKKKSKFLLYISINTYGWINHKFSVLESVENNQLKEREVFWIKKQKSYAFDNENGLNMTRGNHGLSHKKSLKPKNIKRVVAYSLDGNYIGDYSSCRQAGRMLGIKEDDAGRVARGTVKSTKGYIFKFHEGEFDTKINTSQIVLKKVNVPIIQLDDKGTIIQEYASSAEAGRILGLCRKKIHRAMSKHPGKKNTTGYLFMSKEQYNQVINN